MAQRGTKCHRFYGNLLWSEEIKPALSGFIIIFCFDIGNAKSNILNIRLTKFSYAAYEIVLKYQRQGWF